MDSPTQRKASADIAPVKYYTHGHSKVTIRLEMAYKPASDLNTCQKQEKSYGRRNTFKRFLFLFFLK